MQEISNTTGNSEQILTREQRRSKRARKVRARTESIERATKRSIEIARMLNPDVEEIQAERPKTRAQCSGVARPCPWVGCRHNLYLDVSETTGAIKYNFPDLEPDQMPAGESCALDILEREPDGVTLQETGRLMNLTRERVRQLENIALSKLTGEMPNQERLERELNARRLPIVSQHASASLLNKIVSMLDEQEEGEGLTTSEIGDRFREENPDRAPSPAHLLAAIKKLADLGCVVRQGLDLVVTANASEILAEHNKKSQAA